MKEINIEMVRHTERQKKMYEDMHAEIQKGIKGKSVASLPATPSPPPPPVQVEPSIDDSKSMFMANFLAEGTTEDRRMQRSKHRFILRVRLLINLTLRSYNLH